MRCAYRRGSMRARSRQSGLAVRADPPLHHHMLGEAAMRRAGLVSLVLTVWLSVVGAPLHADGCDSGEDRHYRVAPGDTLSVISQRAYGDAARWEDIRAANPELADGAEIRVGMRLLLPCAAVGAATRLGGAGPITLLAAGDFAPFVGRDLPGGGLVAEIATAAFEVGAAPRLPQLQWIEDRAAHLDPLLSGGLMDVGLGWTRPDCTPEDGAGVTPLCDGFLFSLPVFEFLMVPFVRAADGPSEGAGIDVVGKVLCRPRGFPVHDLDRADRRWITEGRITLRQPVSHAACFDQLVRGEVDIVAVDEFSGHAALRAAGLTGQVTALTAQPLSIERLHVIAPRAVPGAAGLIAAFDAGLADIRASGRYQDILDRHLGRFWAAAL